MAAMNPMLNRWPSFQFPRKGMAKRNSSKRVGIKIAPQISDPLLKYFRNWNRNKKYHSGRAAEYGSDASAGAPNSAPGSIPKRRGRITRKRTAAMTARQA